MSCRVVRPRPVRDGRSDGRAGDRADDPLMPGRTVAYMKYQIMERPTVGVAATRFKGRTRLVVGAVGPTPVVVETADSTIDADRSPRVWNRCPIHRLGGVQAPRDRSFVRRVLARLEEVDS